MNFRGDKHDILEEEQFLGVRLEQLLSEFENEFKLSREPLVKFVWGYWRQRMIEECVPLGAEEIQFDPDIRLDLTCKSIV